jgi:hypothetical protein
VDAQSSVIYVEFCNLAVVGMVRILSFFTCACITSYNNPVLTSILVVEKSAATWMAPRKGFLSSWLMTAIAEISVFRLSGQ